MQSSIGPLPWSCLPHPVPSQNPSPVRRGHTPEATVTKAGSTTESLSSCWLLGTDGTQDLAGEG